MLYEKALEIPDQSAFGGPAEGNLSLPRCGNRWTDTQEGCSGALWGPVAFHGAVAVLPCSEHT